MKTNEKLNLTMLCDFYELTMGNGYFVDGKADQICYFDVFFRNVPDGGGFAIADYLCLHDETVNDGEDLEIFDPEATWKRKKVYNFHARELQVPVFRNGELVYQLPTLNEIRSYCREQVDTLWDEVKRFDNPHTYYVDLSQKLWEIKYRLLKDNACGEHHA